MRVYFIFDIKDDFKNIYIGREEYLFIILKSLYELTSKDIDYGYTILRQITNYINKEVLDREIFVKLHREYPYSNKNDIHYYNMLYKNEVSRMRIKRTYIKVETDRTISSFFGILKKYSTNFFVCEFNKLDYFFV